MTDEQTAWPPTQRDHAPNSLVKEEFLFQLQLRDEEGQPWIDYGTPLADRDVMTRNQTYRIGMYPSEKQRVMRHVVQSYVDEVIGDGPDETSRDDLLARNAQVTAGLIAQEESQQPSPHKGCCSVSSDKEEHDTCTP